MGISSRGEAANVKLVVGLGNPGAEYASSRHNAGFMVIERLLATFPAGRFTEVNAAASRFFCGRFRQRALYLQQPLTYMNLSGEAVLAAVRRLEAAPDEVLVISDDLELPLGKLRLRRNGSDGGHNGLKSVIEKLGTQEFKRLRIGIGRPGQGSVSDYVLSSFEAGDRERFDAAIDAAVKAVRLVLSVPFELAMNEVNRREPETTDPADEKKATDKTI